MRKDSQKAYQAHINGLNEISIAGTVIKDLVSEMKEIYLADNRPWIIGFSGGKDSTVVLSLVYSMFVQLTEEERQKPVYVVSSDTLVETPVVVDLIQRVLKSINTEGERLGLPISAHAVYPEMDQTFWVNLLGRGYPAPKQSFRWCTERMKISPVSEFITEKVAQFGEVVVVLGSRSQESASRAQVIAKHKIKGSALSRHTSLSNAYTYMPIEQWSADEVWEYLISAPCPWGGTNDELFGLYKDSNQGECPMVIDTSTPSCGNSRFGCWTCTVVTEDRALHGLIESGNSWMKSLLEFRNALYESNEPENAEIYRHDKRRSNRITFRRARGDEKGELDTRQIRGPYKMKHRKDWLRNLLEIQKKLEEEDHGFPLIREEELQHIRQQWLKDPIEPDVLDELPEIYREVYGDRIQWVENDAGSFTAPDAELLNKLGSRYNVSGDLVMKMIELELSKSGMGKRSGIMKGLDSLLKQDWNIAEALDYRSEEFDKSMVWRDRINNLQEKYTHAERLEKMLADESESLKL
ncbi:MAG: DNA phosphorothioation system sulfurtransferase DndC [Candidatus Thiodiazotropha taylori]